MSAALRAFFDRFRSAPPAAAAPPPPVERQPLLAALAALPDADFRHVAHVCLDIARRHPSPSFEAVGSAARLCLGLPEPAPAAPPTPPGVTDPANDVTVAVTGVRATGQVGGF